MHIELIDVSTFMSFSLLCLFITCVKLCIGKHGSNGATFRFSKASQPLVQYRGRERFIYKLILLVFIDNLFHIFLGHRLKIYRRSFRPVTNLVSACVSIPLLVYQQVCMSMTDPILLVLYAYQYYI